MLLRVAGLIALSSLAAASARAGDVAVSTSPLVLIDVLRAVAQDNLDVRAARSRWEMARAAVPGAKTWPAPFVSFSAEKSPADEKMTHLRAQQDIPFPGKLTQEGAMKSFEAHTARAVYQDRALEMLAGAGTLYYKIFRADRLAEKLRENVDLMKSMTRLAESRLSTGSGSVRGVDVFLLRTELGRMENQLFTEEQDRSLLRIELNAILDRDPLAPVGAPQPPALIDVPMPLADLLVLAEKNSPAYLATLHERGHADRMRARARLAFAPDFQVMYDAQRGTDGRTGSEAGIGLSLPLWFSRPLSDMRVARAHAEENEAMSRAERNDVRRMVATEFTETNTHLTLARRFESALIPAAESAWRLARLQYESGSGDYARLIDAARSLTAVQSDYYDELYHYGEHWGMLQRWSGTPLGAARDAFIPQENSHE